MSFDDIPEDREQSFPCHKCKHGSITQNIITGAWECDNCDFTQCEARAIEAKLKQLNTKG